MEDRRGVAVADFVLICHLVDGHGRSLLGRVNTAENNSGVLHASHRRAPDQYQLELKYLTDSICNVKVEDGWSGYLGSWNESIHPLVPFRTAEKLRLLSVRHRLHECWQHPRL